MDPRQRVRFSFLVRHRDLDRVAFLDHYEHVHGPLAASLGGFRKWTVRYDQNHVLRQVAGETSDIDGITATWQRHRPDYSVGFFQEPDYAVIRRDEVDLFDVDRVRSVLGTREYEWGAGRGEKLLIAANLVDGAVVTRYLESVATRGTITACDTATTSALGAVSEAIAFDLVLEAWFRSASELEEAVTVAAESATAPLVAWSVRELTIVPA